MKRIALHLRRMTLLIALWMLCQIAHVVASLWMLAASIISPHGKRAWTLAIAYDQLANAAFGGNEDETISSRAGRARRKGRRWACLLCRLLDALDQDHCERSIEHRFIDQ
jgi:hypothetical protein